MFRSFHGGIRFDLTDNEALKTDIRRFDEGTLFCVSMLQFDDECEPVVSAGMRVLKGERIGKSRAEHGVDIYSAVSGRVAEIREMTHPTGKTCVCAVIESDGKNEVFPPLEGADPEKLSPETLLDIARRAAIPGPDRYSKPEFSRMRKMMSDGVKTIVCGALDCEPYSANNTRICAQYANEVVGGLMLMMKATGVQNGIIAYTGGSVEAESALRDAVKKHGRQTDGAVRIRLSKTANKYPALLKLEDMFEAASFELSVNAAKAGVTSPFACMAFYRAVYQSLPVTDVFVTVAGTAIGKPGVYEVPVGTKISDLLRRALVSEDVKTVISGGIMRGVALDSTDYPVLLSTTSITAMNETLQFSRNDECIHCNQCGKVCPKGLSPSQICEYISHNDIKEAESLGLNECILCGCCTYICPGRMELNDTLSKGKESMRK